MSRFSPDRIPEDEDVFDGYFIYDEDYEDLYPENEPRRKSKPKEPENPRCRNCLDRRVISDGKGEWVHEDDYRYMCDPEPRSKNTLSAAPVLS